MELLEHVPDPVSVIRACRDLVKPGGDVYFATLNRHPLCRFLAIFAAEILFGLVPRGTHDYRKFIKPSELVTWAQKAGLGLQDLSGLHYYPFIGICRTGGHTRVNYMAHFRRR